MIFKNFCVDIEDINGESYRYFIPTGISTIAAELARIEHYRQGKPEIKTASINYSMTTVIEPEN